MKTLIIDLEATCSDDGSILPEHMEAIEIGAVWMDEFGEIIDQFQRFVRPIERPILTSFCISLTGIKPSEIDQASPWARVSEELHLFMEKNWVEGSRWGSWGAYDMHQIARDCGKHRVRNPLESIRHENFKAVFAKHRKIKQVGMATALKIVGIEPVGEKHRALSDAINIARMIAFCRL